MNPEELFLQVPGTVEQYSTLCTCSYSQHNEFGQVTLYFTDNCKYLKQQQRQGVAVGTAEAGSGSGDMQRQGVAVGTCSDGPH